jgi:hypothetical protein
MVSSLSHFLLKGNPSPGEIALGNRVQGFQGSRIQVNGKDIHLINPWINFQPSWLPKRPESRIRKMDSRVLTSRPFT